MELILAVRDSAHYLTAERRLTVSVHGVHEVLKGDVSFLSRVFCCSVNPNEIIGYCRPSLNQERVRRMKILLELR